MQRCNLSYPFQKIQILGKYHHHSTNSQSFGTNDWFLPSVHCASAKFVCFSADDIFLRWIPVENLSLLWICNKILKWINWETQIWRKVNKNYASFTDFVIFIFCSLTNWSFFPKTCLFQKASNVSLLRIDNHYNDFFKLINACKHAFDVITIVKRSQ